MADEGLDKFEEELRTYVFRRLLAPDSPASRQLRDEIHAAFATQFNTLSAELRGEIKVFHQEVDRLKPQRIDAALQRLERALDDLERAQGNADYSGGAERDDDRRSRRRSGGGFFAGLFREVGIMIGGLAVIGAIGVLGLLALQNAATRAKAPDEAPGVTTEIPQEMTDEQRGWIRMVGEGDRLGSVSAEVRQALCPLSACDLAALDQPARERALQAAMNMLRSDFGCTRVEAITEDGQIGTEGAGQMRAVVACVGEAPAEDPRCRENACQMTTSVETLTVETKAIWTRPMLDWSLRLLGRNRQPT